MDSIEQLRTSFFYGERSDLNFKFARDLSDEEFGDFLSELFEATAAVMDGADATAVVDVAYRWQVQAYAGHLGDPANFPHRKDTTPITPLGKPLAECKILVLTSSGHFVDGDDPEPLGVVDMTQAEAEARITEFVKSPATLSVIPVDTPADQIRVRHGGYPVQAAAADPQVVLPLGHLQSLVADGVIAGLTNSAFSFVGATAQGHIKRSLGPEWAQLAIDQGADAALLVPI
jgi:hypothetical protein